MLLYSIIYRYQAIVVVTARAQQLLQPFAASSWRHLLPPLLFFRVCPLLTDCYRSLSPSTFFPHLLALQRHPETAEHLPDWPCHLKRLPLPLSPPDAWKSQAAATAIVSQFAKPTIDELVSYHYSVNLSISLLLLLAHEKDLVVAMKKASSPSFHGNFPEFESILRSKFLIQPKP